jgi:putative redox protein
VSAPPIVSTLTWDGDLRFRAVTGANTIILDSDSAAGPSPPQAVAMALAGCMAIDVADIVQKGRHELTAMEARITGERAPDPPRRFTRFTLHFAITGRVPAHAVERAIQLSRDKYCSVWHSLKTDIALETTFEVTPAPFDSGSAPGGR